MRYCIKIETIETYELFNDIKEAYNYLKKNKERVIYTSLVKAKNTFKEAGVLNYEDKSDTLNEEIDL